MSDAGPGVLRAAALVSGKDLRLEWRTRTAMTQVGPFVIAVLMLFGFALDADAPTLERTTSGLYWVTVVFASMLLISRSAQCEREPGVADALALSGLPPVGAFLGKVAALAVQIVAVEALVLAGVLVLYNITIRGWGVVVASSLVATTSIAALGAMYGAVVGGARSRDALLAVLVLPALAPVLLAATRAWETAAGRGLGEPWPWVAMLAAIATVELLVGAAAWGALTSDA